MINHTKKMFQLKILHIFDETFQIKLKLPHVIYKKYFSVVKREVDIYVYYVYKYRCFYLGTLICIKIPCICEILFWINYKSDEYIRICNDFY